MTTSSSPNSRPNGLLTALNTIRNTGRPKVSEAAIRSMLETGRGDPVQVRVLFSDVSLDVLSRLALAYDLPVGTLCASYARARAETAAANPELYALIASG